MKVYTCPLGAGHTGSRALSGRDEQRLGIWESEGILGGGKHGRKGAGGQEPAVVSMREV